MTYLPERTADEQARITADFVPNGIMWQWKRVFSHDGFKWLRGVSRSFSRIEGILNEWMSSLNITTNTKTLDEWEDCVGIPDNYFPGNSTEANRQKHVITKISSEGLSPASDIEWVCSLMGLFVNVYPGKYFYDNFDPRVGTFSSVKEARFTMVVELIPELSDDDSITTFPLPFPIQFGLNNYGVMQKHILRIIPANVDVRWIVSDMEIWINTSYSDDIKIQDTTSGDIVQNV